MDSIDTAVYYYAAYAVFWLLPTLFVIKTFSDVKNLSGKLHDLKKEMK